MAQIIPLVTEALEKVESGTPGERGPLASMPGITGYLATTSELLPPWPSRQRDIVMSAEWKNNDHLAGILYHAQMRLMATLPLFEAKKPTVTAHVEAADEFQERIYLTSEFGEGLPVTMEKAAEDYLAADNGMHLEVMGAGDPAGPIEGPALGIRHLDSTLITRTGHPIYPALYRSPDNGKLYKFHFSRIISVSQMPSSRRSANGVGFSSVGRSFQVAQTLYDGLVYQLEKMGSRPQTQVVYSESMSATEMIKHFMVAEEMMNQLGLKRFTKVIALGNVKGLGKLDLNNFELFNQEIMTLMAIYSLCYIWGLNVRTLFPYNIGGGSSDAELSDVIGRSQLPAAWMRSLRHQFNAKVTPSYLKTVFDNKNDEEDQQKAVIDDIRARSRQRNMASKVTTESIERRLMLRNGEITREDFADMELSAGRLEDGTSVAALFSSQDKTIAPLLVLEGIEKPLVIEANTPKEARLAIHLAQADAYEYLASTTSLAQQRRVKQALAALEWLDSEYKTAGLMQLTEDSSPDEQEEAESEGFPRQEPTTVSPFGRSA